MGKQLLVGALTGLSGSKVCRKRLLARGSDLALLPDGLVPLSAPNPKPNRVAWRAVRDARGQTLHLLPDSFVDQLRGFIERGPSTPQRRSR